MSEEQKSMVSELAQDLIRGNLGEQTDKKEEEKKLQEEKNLESKEEVVESQEDKQPDVITEDVAKEFGLSATFIGKPKAELAKVFREAQKDVTRNRQQNAELKKQFEELQESRKEIKEETGIDVSKIPSPLDDEEGFMKAMGNLVAKSKPDIDKESLVKDIAMEVVKVLQPEIQPAKDLAIQNAENEMYKAIQNQLPKGEDAKQIANLWAEENKETLEFYSQIGQSPYSVKGGEQLMAKHILQFYGSIAYDNLKKNQKEIVDKELESRLKKKAQNAEKNISAKNTSDRNETGNQKTGLVSELANDLKKTVKII